uniref:Uncharacterized protein n=1 Tax=Arundo donax TaxID=35708 RepID=A0A0A9C0S5_ARUDO
MNPSESVPWQPLPYLDRRPGPPLL